MEICTCHYKEDLEWLKKSEYPVTVIHKEGGSPLSNKPDFIIPNTGLEITAYLKFIIERYDTLPEHTAFIHGHETAHHQLGDRPLLDMIKTANISKYDFINLNNIWRCSPAKIVFGEFRETVNKLLNVVVPDLFITCACAQFIVSRNAILRNSKEYYINIYNFHIMKIIDPPPKQDIMEHAWQIVFTGEFNVVPKDDNFIPPMKPLMSSSSCYPFRVKDISLCYMGKNPPLGSIHIKSQEIYDDFSHKGPLYFIFNGDELENENVGIGNIAFIDSSQYVMFLYMYQATVQEFEKIFLNTNGGSHGAEAHDSHKKMA
jgi:hypothetical protein